jgi:predicted transcriptional regulator of viral defense system
MTTKAELSSLPSSMLLSREAQVSRTTLSRHCQTGKLQRVGRGVYLYPGADVTENHSLLEAFLQVPHGVVCLLSALRFHQLTTQSPYDVWMAIANKAYRPKVNYPPIHFVRFSEPTLTYGIEQHSIEGRSLPITSSAKTVADCFKYRHKIGQDVAIEALRDYLSSGRSVGILLEACGVCRVGRVIRPYLDALL